MNKFEKTRMEMEDIKKWILETCMEHEDLKDDFKELDKKLEHIDEELRRFESLADTIIRFDKGEL
jgi:archaellum component FlaC